MFKYLINTKQTSPVMSITEKIAMVIDVPGRVCYVKRKNDLFVTSGLTRVQ